MKVSIIIPVYNVEQYLTRCIDSILNQTFSDFEAIFIDDGSTDNSLGIINSYSCDKRIVSIHKTNEGAGLARNVGLNKATGEYITFIDPDDYVNPKYIEKMVYEMDKGFDLVMNGHNEVLNDETLFRKHNFEETTVNNPKSQLLPKLLGSSPERSDNIGSNIWSRMYSRKIIEDNKIRFLSERVIGSEDIIFNFDYMINIDSVKICSDNNYNQTVRIDSLSKKYDSNRFDNYKTLYLELFKRINKYDMGDECIYRAMRGFFVNWRLSLSQENRSISKNNIFKEYSNIKKVFNDELVVDVLNKYPINRTGFKQKVLLYIVKYKMVVIMMLLIDTRMF